MSKWCDWVGGGRGDFFFAHVSPTDIKVLVWCAIPWATYPYFLLAEWDVKPWIVKNWLLLLKNTMVAIILCSGQTASYHYPRQIHVWLVDHDTKTNFPTGSFHRRFWGTFISKNSRCWIGNPKTLTQNIKKTERFVCHPKVNERCSLKVSLGVRPKARFV